MIQIHIKTYTNVTENLSSELEKKLSLLQKKNKFELKKI